MNTIHRMLLPVVLAVIGTSLAHAQEAKATLTIISPTSRQVFQRDAKDQAELTIKGTVTGQPDAIEVMAGLVQGATRG